MSASYRIVRSLRLSYDCRGHTLFAIELTLAGKRRVVKTTGEDGLKVSCGIGENATEYAVGSRLGVLMLETLTEQYPPNSWLNKVISEASLHYGRDVMEGGAPDRTFSVRAGKLMPMNRLPNDEDADTLTMSSVVERVQYGTGEQAIAA